MLTKPELEKLKELQIFKNLSEADSAIVINGIEQILSTSHQGDEEDILSVYMMMIKNMF